MANKIKLIKQTNAAKGKLSCTEVTVAKAEMEHTEQMQRSCFTPREHRAGHGREKQPEINGNVLHTLNKKPCHGMHDPNAVFAGSKNERQTLFKGQSSR